MRWFLVLLCSALLAVGGFGMPASEAKPVGSRHYGEVMNILPPGNAGNVDAAALAQLGPGKAAGDPASLLSGLADPKGFFTTATPSQPRNFADQLEKYDALNTANPHRLTDAHSWVYIVEETWGWRPSGPAARPASDW